MNRYLRLHWLMIAAAATACGGERNGGGDAAAPSAPAARASTSPLPPIAASVAAPIAVPRSPAGAPMDPIVEPEIHAQIRPVTVASGKSPTLLVTVKNPGKGFLFVPDPERGGDALQVHLTRPSGEEIVVSPGAASAEGDRGGIARPMLASAKILPGETTTFDFEIAALAIVTAPGRYTLVVDYAWNPSAPRWRSPTLAFTVTPR